MDIQSVNQTPSKPPKNRKTLLLVVAFVVLIGLAAGILVWKHIQIEHVKSDLKQANLKINNLNEKNKKLQAEFDSKKETTTTTTTQTTPGATDKAMIEAAVQSVCGAKLDSCSDIKVLRQTEKYAEVTVTARSQNTTNELPYRSILLKKTSGNAWQTAFFTNEAKLCEVGTDQPDMVSYCRS